MADSAASPPIFRKLHVFPAGMVPCHACQHRDEVMTTDYMGRITFLNPLAGALTGWTQ